MSETPDPVIDQFIDALWLEEGLSKNTLSAYRRDLEAYARWLHTRSQGLLASEGYAPQTRIMELERQVAAAEGRGKDLVSSIARSQSAIGESEQRIAQRQQEYRKEVDNLLAQIRMEYQSNLERYKASSEELERTQVKAPVDGQVVGLQIQVVGAVLQPAQKLMDIVPQDERLVLEAAACGTLGPVGSECGHVGAVQHQPQQAEAA